jgi:hypothetical protein
MRTRTPPLVGAAIVMGPDRGGIADVAPEVHGSVVVTLGPRHGTCVRVERAGRVSLRRLNAL